MDSWLLIQIFLSGSGLFEVELNPTTWELRCNCPGFSVAKRCKHVQFVKERFDWAWPGIGAYRWALARKIPPEELAALLENARSDPERFSNFVRENVRVEVMGDI